MGDGRRQSGAQGVPGERHNELQATLAKRSEDGADMPTIVREFAALWLPHHMVEVELLVPALEDADVDEVKRAAVAVRKDMLNILLGDLIQSGAAQGRMQSSRRFPIRSTLSSRPLSRKPRRWTNPR